MDHLGRGFLGAKLALFLGARLVMLQRDAHPGLIWPGFWDLPGGGREPGETPLDTALRETREEFTLTVPPAQVRWGRAYVSSVGQPVWFFVGHLSARAEQDVQLGNEGQGWSMWTVDAFMTHPKVVPQFQSRLQDYLCGVAPDRRSLWASP